MKCPQTLSRRSAVACLGLGAAALLRAGPALAQTPALDHVTLDEARRLHESGAARLIDVREPHEHATGVAPGAQLLPLSLLGQRAQEIPKNRPVLLICNTQNRSPRALAALQKAGWTNLRYVEGGMSEWARRQWPMVKP